MVYGASEGLKSKKQCPRTGPCLPRPKLRPGAQLFSLQADITYIPLSQDGTCSLSDMPVPNENCTWLLCLLPNCLAAH